MEHVQVTLNINSRWNKIQRKYNMTNGTIFVTSA
jgi:hypothetical protein